MRSHLAHEVYCPVGVRQAEASEWSGTVLYFLPCPSSLGPVPSPGLLQLGRPSFRNSPLPHVARALDLCVWRGVGLLFRWLWGLFLELPQAASWGFFRPHPQLQLGPQALGC